MKRVFLIVLDSLGIGFLSDAERFSDVGADTLKSISKSDFFNIPNLLSLGISNIEGLSYLGENKNPTAALFKNAEKSSGKDTTTGHWEMAGIISKKPMPTFPNGFPEQIINEFSEKTGRGVLCNAVASGTEVIKEFGKEHLETGKLIVYTSADSVFQIAAHEDIVPVEMLYEYCKKAREILIGDYAVGRVIARPFKGEAPDFYRTENRRDFSLSPPSETMLDFIKKSGKDVIAVGKISDIFAGKGITQSLHTHNNREGIQAALKFLKTDFEGLCFINLVDFDMLYGHRQDVDGYAKALSEFDSFIPSFISQMKNDDILMITADHGCDPADESTDHTREYTPLIIYGEKIKNGYFGKRETFADIGKTVLDYLDIRENLNGESLLPLILKEN